jgi:site-specific DNA-methyltransferase (adenine-specific)
MHEAVFPENFARDMIFSFSEKGDLIYDMFGGSGTTCKMAELMGRKWFMSECSEKNCLKAQKRISHYAKRDIEIV